MSKKLWNKGSDVDKDVEKYLFSDMWADQQLVKYECIASIAHAKMLHKLNVISKKELDDIVDILNKIIELDINGNFNLVFSDEDVHTKIENYLVEKLGDTGKKIHTYRSRNEQLLVNPRLYHKDKLEVVKMELIDLINTINGFAKDHNIPMPGFTHLQKATPSSVAMWADAFKEALEDDLIVLENAIVINDQNPLGSGSSYGVPGVVIDREYTTKVLGFSKTQKNPLYCQNSRGKIESVILNALSQIMINLSQMCQDIIIFSCSEFGYFKLSSKVSTGSSMMPQKKNPDLAELIKGNASVMLSYDSRVKNAITGVASGYVKETQVIKEATMKGLLLAIDTLSVMKKQINGIIVDKEKCKQAMTPELYATENAYKLVEQGMPFRDAYKKVAEELNKG